MMWQAGGFWVLWMLLFWGGLVALAVAGLRTLTPRSGSRTSTALSILEESPELKTDADPRASRLRRDGSW